MNPASSPWPRRLLIGGLVLMIAAAIDPLEGSVVILTGVALAAAAAHRLHSQYRRQLLAALALTTVGVAALWGVSALGGFGGDTGRSNWWVVPMLPYPIGWMLAIAGAARELRRPRHGAQA